MFRHCLALVSCFLVAACAGRGTGPVPIVHLGNAPEAVRSPYRIQSGDLLELRFGQAEELDGDVRVLPDGRISVPLVGELIAEGATVTELAARMRARYSEVLLDPDVTVAVREFQNPTVYVIGEVARPGGFAYSSTVTALRAVGEAGGFTGDAARGRVLVIRNAMNAVPETYEIDLEGAMGGARGSVDAYLQPDDVIVVPTTRMAAAGDAVAKFDAVLPALLRQGVSYGIGIVASQEVRDMWREDGE